MNERHFTQAQAAMMYEALLTVRNRLREPRYNDAWARATAAARIDDLLNEFIDYTPPTGGAET